MGCMVECKCYTQTFHFRKLKSQLQKYIQGTHIYHFFFFFFLIWLDLGGWNYPFYLLNHRIKQFAYSKFAILKSQPPCLFLIHRVLLHTLFSLSRWRHCKKGKHIQKQRSLGVVKLQRSSYWYFTSSSKIKRSHFEYGGLQEVAGIEFWKL